MNGNSVCVFVFPGFTVVDGDDFRCPFRYIILTLKNGSDYLRSMLSDMLNSQFVPAASSSPFCFPCH
jgi:hypothetical protein